MKQNKVLFNLRRFFTYQASEKTSALIFAVLIFMVILFVQIYPRLFSRKEKIDVSEFKNEIKTFEQGTDSIKRSFVKELNKNRRLAYASFQTGPVKQNQKKVELNSADSSSLEALPGIGPYSARQIIKYRNMLGGFYTLDQINEVYNIHPDNIGKCMHLLTLDTTCIRKINLKIADFKEINRHPYISYEQTKAIMKFRDQEKLNCLDDLKASGIFDSLLWKKIRPYLTLE